MIDLPASCPFTESYDEIDEMIGALAREKELKPGISPDLVGGDPDRHYYWGRGNEGRHKQSVEWRVKLFHELKSRPKWIAEWRARQEFDRRIRELCQAKGLEFRPWECPPWNAPDELPSDEGSWELSYRGTVRQAVRLRRQLIAELEAESA